MMYRKYWGKLFATDEVAAEYSKTVKWLWLYSFPDSLVCAGMAILRGCGRPTTTVWINLIACLAIGLPCSAVLALYLQIGLPGVWLGMGVGWLTSAAIHAVLISRFDWAHEAKRALKRVAEGTKSMDWSSEGTNSESGVPLLSSSSSSSSAAAAATTEEENMFNED